MKHKCFIIYNFHSFILFINNFEDMLKESERYLLSTYNRKLDEENKAKNASNKLLRQHLEKGENSQMTSATSINSNGVHFLNYKTKDNETENSNKNIADLNENNQIEPRKVNQVKGEPQTILSDLHSQESNVEIRGLPKRYDELERSHKNFLDTIKVDGNQLIQTNPQIEKLKQDFSMLKDKVRALEQKLFEPQNSLYSNTYVREPINSIPLSITYNSNPAYRTSVSPQNIVSFPLEMQQYHSYSYANEFPLYSHLDYPISSPVLQTQQTNSYEVNCECQNFPQISAFYRNVNDQPSQPTYCNSLTEVQLRNLSYKIRVLQEINERLRCRISKH